MNGPATFRDQYWPSNGIFATHNAVFRREKTMTSAVAAFGIAVGRTSLIWYLLMSRLQNRRANRASSGDGSGGTAAIMAAATAEAFLIGSVATIPLWTVRAIRSTSAAAIAEEAVMAAATGVAVAIDAAGLSEKRRPFDLPQQRFFRFILVCVTHHFGIT
jgi:hypothetical protein